MFENPFTPVFGGKPGLFFGRKRILDRFDAALSNQGSDARALFVTGSRGYGKTALLEQLSMRAHADGRKVIDVGPDSPISNIMRHLVAFDESTKSIDPEVEISVFGTGGKLRGGSYSRTIRYDEGDFPYLFLDACEQEGMRLFLSIDEVQKVSLDDMSVICNAFQMASRKGYDVMLAVAGLPYAHRKVIQHDGCTFLRRGEHEELGPFSSEEVRAAFASVFAGIRGISIDDAALDMLVAMSKGHPYVMQLEGYYLIDMINGSNSGAEHLVTLEDVRRIAPDVLSVYARHATRPLLEELPPVEVGYLEAMARVLDENRVARTGDIAETLGRKQSQTSAAREYLLANGIVYSPGQGKLVFAIPYLADYLLERGAPDKSGLATVQEWKM